MKSIRLLFLLSVFLPVILCGQDTQVFLSKPFDQLIIGKTKLKEAEKLLGKPTERRVPPIIQHAWEKQIMLMYNDSQQKLLLRFGYKSEKLFNITFDSAAVTTINNTIRVGISDTAAVLKIFGTPAEVDRKPTYPYFFYSLVPYDVYFTFDKPGILIEASFFKHSNYIKDTTAVDTTTFPFGIWVRHKEKGLKYVKVNFVTGNDTVTITTNKDGFADISLSKKKPYPKIVIRQNDFEIFEVQITDAYLNDGNLFYKRIDLSRKKNR